MRVVVHQSECMDEQSEPASRLDEKPYEKLPVLVVNEYLSLFDSASHAVKECAGCIESQWSCHGYIRPRGLFCSLN